MSIGKFPAGPLPNDYKIQGRDDVEPLITTADTGDQVARRLPAKTGIVPVLMRPSWLQHLLEIELAAVRRGAVVPPA